MTREEAIQVLKSMKSEESYNALIELCDMAIESLSQPIVAKHFDIQSGYIYCSPQIAENVKVVVKCQDCKHWKPWECSEHNVHTHEDDYCSKGERLCNYFGERRE